MSIQSIVYSKPNKIELLKLEPPPLAPNEIRLRTLATSIAAGVERLLITGRPVTKRELKFPIISGSECIGEAIEIGNCVESVEIGDYVFAWKANWKNMNNIAVQSVFGCNAESLAVAEGDCISLGREPKESDLLVGLLSDAISAAQKISRFKTARILILGLGALGITLADVLRNHGFNDVDGCEMFIQRGKLANVKDVALDIADFTSDYNGQYDVIIECTGRLLLLESAVRLLKPQGTFLLCGSYEEMKLDYRLLQEKEPQLIFSAVSTRAHKEDSKTMLEMLDIERLLTHRFTLSQYETAFDVALNNPDCLKTSLIW